MMMKGQGKKQIHSKNKSQQAKKHILKQKIKPHKKSIDDDDEIQIEDEDEAQSQQEETDDNEDEKSEEQESNDSERGSPQNSSIASIINPDDEEEAIQAIPNESHQGKSALHMEQEDSQNIMQNTNLPPDLAMINMRIHEILKILTNLRENREGETSRQTYIGQLIDYFCAYFGYNRELIELFMSMFNPNECYQFLDANEQQRPMSIRTNTLKTRKKELAQTLIQRGVNLDQLADWTKVGLKIFDSKVPVGATPEYLAGHYMIQSASSFIPVMALAPQLNERILDMAAAPGGKSTYISQLMRNTGNLFANDLKRERLPALRFNLQRMGCQNSIVTNYDGRKFPKVMKNFDRVLLDAPCSGLGIISRDPSIKSNRVMRDIYIAAHLQKELILAAIDCLKVGGYIVYSTCSVSVQENEAVIDYALKNRYVKIVDMGLEIGEDGYIKYQDKRFDPNIKKAKRIFPHIHNMDGFFVCKLRKYQNGNPRKPELQKLNPAQANKKQGIETVESSNNIKKQVEDQADENYELEDVSMDEEEEKYVPKGEKKGKGYSYSNLQVKEQDEYDLLPETSGGLKGVGKENERKNDKKIETTQTKQQQKNQSSEIIQKQLKPKDKGKQVAVTITEKKNGKHVMEQDKVQNKTNQISKPKKDKETSKPKSNKGKETQETQDKQKETEEEKPQKIINLAKIEKQLKKKKIKKEGNADSQNRQTEAFQRKENKYRVENEYITPVQNKMNQKVEAKQQAMQQKLQHHNNLQNSNEFSSGGDGGKNKSNKSKGKQLQNNRPKSAQNRR